MAALITLLQMATQNRSPADLDCGHDAMLRHRHRSAILQAIICAVAAEYIRYVQPRAIHRPPCEEVFTAFKKVGPIWAQHLKADHLKIRLIDDHLNTLKEIPIS